MRIDAVWLDLTRSRGIGTYGCLGGLRGTLNYMFSCAYYVRESI